MPTFELDDNIVQSLRITKQNMVDNTKEADRLIHYTKESVFLAIIEQVDLKDNSQKRLFP